LLIIAIEYEGSSDAYSATLDYFNYIFTAIFIIECGIKLLANGLGRYFYVAWNIFDFIVVASSIIDLVISNALGSNVSFIKSLQIIRVLRVMRVTR
jgi:voltage-dependent calcium channel L type alpha-1D